MEEQRELQGENATKEQVSEKRGGFFNKYGPVLFLIGFLIYIALLITGTIAEIFDIQPILDWWIWRPPGR
jgi:hypothetical protein